METIPVEAQDLRRSLYDWAGSLVERTGDERLMRLPWDECQSILEPETVKYESVPADPAEVFALSSNAIGEYEFSQLVRDLQNARHGAGPDGSLLKMANAWLGLKGHGVLLTTDHENIMDLVIAKNAIYCAMGDISWAKQSGIIINEATSLLAFNGRHVTDILKMSGNVYVTRPLTSSANLFGITDDLAKKINYKMLHSLLSDVHRLDIEESKSMLLAASVTGSTAIKRVEKGQLQSLELPAVNKTTASIVIKHFRYALPVSMYLPNLTEGKKWYEIHQINPIYQPHHLEEVVETMGASMSAMSELPVYYKGREIKLGETAIGASLNS